VCRRIWRGRRCGEHGSADPAIRDFIGLSENSWDFNVLGGVPGFGSLTAEEVRRLVAQVMENTASPAADRLSDDKVLLVEFGDHFFDLRDQGR
jgi:hypothetical protein